MTSKRSKKYKRAGREERRITVRGVRRDPPDIRKLSKALIALAQAEAEREAQADQESREAGSANNPSDKPAKGGAPNA